MDSSNESLMTREPAVAGQFYPGDPNGLRSLLQRLFNGAANKLLKGNSLAIISPHAGYIYSGAVAAAAFMQVDPDKEYENIFIIGSSHRFAFNGASVYTQGNFKTPLGIIPVNIKLSLELISASDVFTDRSDAQISEHSLEVQLPFLQYRLKRPFQIVPIVIATQHPPTCHKIAGTLLPYFKPANLFVISTDFSHYPDYENACRVDRLTAEAILTNDPEVLLKTLGLNEQAGVPGLSTCLCGWASVLTLMYMTEKMEGIHYTLIDYKNSGDATGIENKSRVVGYYALSIEQKDIKSGTTDQAGMMITVEDKHVLLALARSAITSDFIAGQKEKPGSESLSPALLQRAGVFVSLYKQGKLRGCIGRFSPDLPLYELVQEMAIASALHDRRFSPLKANEIPELKIEISILTPLKKIDSIEDIELGRHGIYIKKGPNTGTFLPQVALNTGWSKEEFLEHCSSDKAGIGRNGWKEAELFTYEAIVIKEE
jgi:hypothetical protein